MTDFFQDKQPQAQLMDFLLGPIRWNIIKVALEISLFDQLEEAKSSSDIAKELSLKEDKVTLLLNSLCSLNIVKKHQQEYALEDSLKPYLLSHSTCSMREMLLHLSNIKQTSTETLKDILKSGKSEHISAGFRNEDFWRNSQKSLHSFHSSIHNELMMNLLNRLPEWNNARSIIDLGAGSEALSLALKAAKPDIKVSLFDLPSCTKYIQSRLPKDADINIISGDFNIDSIGSGYDVILSSMSLYYAKDLQHVLGKIKQALNKGGLFLSLHEALQEERTQPEAHITGRFLPALSGSDLSFNDGFIFSQMQDAGFSRMRHKYIDTPIGQLRLDIGVF